MVAAEMHHELSGPDDAPVVMLSCSLGTDLSTWDPQARRLSETLRVLRCDLLGDGRDRARAVREHGIEPLVDAAIDRWFTRAFAQQHPEILQPRRQNLLATPSRATRRVVRPSRT